MHPAVQVAIALARNRRARKLLLTLAAGVAIALFFVITVLVSSVGAAASICQKKAEERSSSPGGTPIGYVPTKPSQQALADIPAHYLDAYRRAAEEYGIDWAVLAAIGKIESGHGEGGKEVTCIGSSAGAMGPMQFMPSTWASQGVDGNGDGVKDVCYYEDAIFGAASYLANSGAPQDYRAAIFAYNHAGWYVDDVLAQAEQYRSAGEQAPVQASRQPSSLVGSSSGWSAPTGGSGQPPQAWELVDGERTIDYELDTQYASYFEVAEAGWNELGGVRFEPSQSSSETDLVVVDGELSGQMGLTTSNGVMTVDSSLMAASTDNARVALFGHEQGHALGFEHTQEDSIMNLPIVTNSNHNTTALTSYDGAQYREVWGGSGAPSGSTGQEGGSRLEGNAKVVFPLPREHFDSYEDTWGASRPQNGAGGVHEGTDLMAREGTPVYSITSGEVVPVSGSDSSGWNSLGGWAVMVEADGSVGPIQQGDLLYYAHQRRMEVEIGQRVEAGDVIGHVGTSGQGPRGTTGTMPPHLHLGWYDPTGQRAQAPSGAINPYPLLQWLNDNGGTATNSDTDTLAPSPGGEGLPAYCIAFQGIGTLSGIADFFGGSEAGGDAGGGDRASTSNDPKGPLDSPRSEKPTGDSRQVLAAAEEYVGVPYVLGGASMDGIDSSGLTMRAYEAVRIQLPHWNDRQLNYGEPVAQGNLQPGDLVFFSELGVSPHGTNGVTDVGIYSGNGMMVHASSYFGEVTGSKMRYVEGYIGARILL